MASILGIGNALTDILAVLPDTELLEKFNLPLGSMQHVDADTGNKMWEELKKYGIKYVAGGSAANTISTCAIFGMQSGFIGKVGVDEIGSLFKSDQKQNGIHSMVTRGKAPSGRSMIFVAGPNSERTLATYLGAASELIPEDLDPTLFDGYDMFHVEGYLVQNQRLIRKAIEIAHSKGMTISIDLASYNVVASNSAFLHDIISNYVDIVFANEMEAKSYTQVDDPREALDIIAQDCKIAIVKLGKDGSTVKCGNEFHRIDPYPANTIDVTGAGDLYAGGFLYALSEGMPLDVCGKVGSIISSKVVEVIGSKVDIPRWRDAKKEIRELMGITKE